MNQRSENEIFGWAKYLFPINRSLSGEGVRSTLNYLQKILPELKIKGFDSGSSVCDWTIPDEWGVEVAFIADMNGNHVLDYAWNNLHLVGYSESVDCIMTKSQLAERVHYLEEQPDLIPYVTSYYKRTWGFCIEYNRWKSLADEQYRVVIVSRLFKGQLNYGEIYLPGSSKQEILLSSYICHPSMFSNELSGPIVLTAVFDFLDNLPSRHYSYRGLLLPETIGSIAYLHENISEMKKNIIAGWVLTCLADEGDFSYIPSRLGQSYADRMTLKFASENKLALKKYTWLDRGSDERQYSSPLVDLPICSVTRTKYDEYAEYHTSADDLKYGSKKGLFGSFEFYRNLIREIEKTRTPRINVLGEPQMGRRNLYPTTSKVGGGDSMVGQVSVQQLMNVISFLDGQHNMEEIAKKCALSQKQVDSALQILEIEGLITY
jgi:aminopeptidase-like protein